MNIFTRRELFVTMDLMKFNEVINLLHQENIPFTYNTRNSTNTNGRAHLTGLNSKGMFLYYIYVHKDHIVKAQALLK